MADDDASVGTDAESPSRITVSPKASPAGDVPPGNESGSARVRLSAPGLRRVILGSMLAVLLAVGLWLDYRHSLASPLPLKAPVVFRIEKGATLSQLAGDLQNSGILVDSFWFRFQAWSSHVSLKYGDYEIAQGTTMRGLLDLFASGRIRKLAVTVIEGWNFAQMRSALARQPQLVQLTPEQTPEQLMVLLGHPGLSPEGLFFPDTYRIDSRTTDLAILKLAYRQMQSLLEEEWAQRAPDLPYKTPYEALIMASIIEKETGLAEERPQIAGVFIRRLRQGMRLQTDPTVIYGMGEQYRGDIRKDDLRRDTPYNTYTRSGLPPTPIALPGRASIHAALHPAEGSSLYFVARGDGGHVFSTTLKDHQQAVNQYQKH